MVMAPISLAFAVAVLQAVSEGQMSGIIHASATQDVTYANATQLIAQKFRAEKNLVEPISYREAEITFSPKHATLDSTMLAEF